MRSTSFQSYGNVIITTEILVFTQNLFQGLEQTFDTDITARLVAINHTTSKVEPDFAHGHKDLRADSLI